MTFVHSSFFKRPVFPAILSDKSQRRALYRVLLLAAGLRFLAAAGYYNPFDLGPYNIPWSIYGAQDRFGLYSNPAMAEFGLDYPPIFPFLLSLVGTPVLWAHEGGCWPVEMFCIKLFPVLADLALVALLWLIGADFGLPHPWKLALAWALNPAALYNSGFWGQADSFLLFFVLGMHWLLQRRQPELAAIVFALGCLTKLQMCYFAPVLLLSFWLLRLPLRRWVGALAVGGTVGFLGWFPFMRRGEWLKLPLRIYLGGYNKYNSVNAKAANLYALGDHYGQPDTDLWFSGVTFQQVSTIFTALAMLWLVWCAVRSARQKTTPPLCVISLIYLEILFLFTTRQHERYQLPVLILAVFWWCLEQNRIPMRIAGILTGITFINQFYVVTADNHPASASFCALLEKPTAAANLILFGCILALLFSRLQQKDASPAHTR